MKFSYIYTFLMENWTIKKAECQRIYAFELWRWRILLRVPWTARRSNQYILKEISPEYSLERQMLKLKLQYFDHLMWKDPDAEKDWRQEEKGMAEDEMVGWYHWFNGHEFEQAQGVGDGQGNLACYSLSGQSWTRLNEGTELNWADTFLKRRWELSGYLHELTYSIWCDNRNHCV